MMRDKSERITPSGHRLGLAILLALASFQSSLGWMPFSTTRCYRHPLATRGAVSDNKAEINTNATISGSSRSRVTGVTIKVAFDRNWGVAEMADDAPSVRFTCDKSLDMVHRLRRDSDGVLVGRGTVERDDCSLTVRRGVVADKQPLRVILDPRLSLLLAELNEGAKYQVIEDGLPTVIYHMVSDVDVESLNLLPGVTLVCLVSPSTDGDIEMTHVPEGYRPGQYISPRVVVKHLHENFNVQHIMVEGGPSTVMSFLQQDGLVDRAIIVQAPISFQEPFPSGMSVETLKSAGLELVGTRQSGVDTIDYWLKPGQSWPTDPAGDYWP
jgi:riboflavin biosynthesis pyrimidine reductase